MSSPLREHVFSGGNLPGRLLGALPRGFPRRLAFAGRAISSSSPSTVCLVLRMRLWLQRESCIRCFGGVHVVVQMDYSFDGLTCLLGRIERHVVQPLRFQYPIHAFCDGVLIRVPVVGVSHAPAALSHSPCGSIGIPCRSGASVLLGTSGGTMREPSSVPSEALQCQVSGAVHSPQSHGYRHP